jgi:penicillin-binding protein 2
MKKMFRSPHLLIESRFFAGSLIIVGAALMLWLRVWHLQIYRGDYYRRVSENNRIRKIEIPAPRGILFDAWGKVILGNTPSSDLIVIPQYMRDKDKTFEVLARLLHQPIDIFERKFKAARAQPRFMPITMLRNLSGHEVSIIESNRLFLPGIEVRTTARREYNTDVSPHMLGYLGEINPTGLEEINAKSRDNPYTIGDLVGKQGLEARLEPFIRGKRGYKVIQVDAFGRASNPGRQEWQLPMVSAQPGANVELTIDLELQQSVGQAFSGKNGAVVVMDPKSGAILAMTSQPTWDPYIYQRGMTSEEFRALTLDPLHPFMDKTTGGEFAPGSTYKAVVALAGLQEGTINASKSYFCGGSFTLGTQTFGCHKKDGHGTVNLRRALMQSCDVYFYHVGIELGVDRIAKYARALGLGTKLGLELNMERPGLVPTEAWKVSVHKEPWAAGETPPVAIGQGYNLVTPLQMASLYAAIANKGQIWKPFLIKRISGPHGNVLEERQPKLLRVTDAISPENYDLVRQGLQAVVMDEEGTGKRARVPGINVAGKTGSVQVVNLKKNKNQTDVSILWKEHAMFASFAPAQDPEIVVAVISEHDDKGGGGASAAPVAGFILNKYFELKKRRTGLAIGAATQAPEAKSPTTPSHDSATRETAIERSAVERSAAEGEAP